MRKQLGRIKRRLTRARRELEHMWLSARDPELAGVLDHVRGSSVAELKPWLEGLVAERGAPAVERSVEEALTHLVSSGGDSDARNLFTAALRAFSFTDLERALAFGDRHVDQIQDRRARHSLVLFHRKARNFDRALDLLESMERDAWHEETTDSLIKAREAAAVIAECNVHFQRGDLTAALEVLETRGDPSDPRVDMRTRQMRAFQHFRESGFTSPLEPDSEKFWPAPNAILCPLHNSLPFASGGYATRSHGLFTGARARGWDVRAVTRLGFPKDREGHEQTRCPTLDIIDGVPYHHMVPPGQGLGKAPMDEYLVQYATALHELAHRVRPAVIHAAANFMNGVVGNSVARALGIKSIYEVRGLWEVTRMSRQEGFEGSEYFEMMRRLEAQAAADADAVICITEALADEMVSRGVDRDKITIVPNGVNVERFTPRDKNAALARELGLESKQVIGYIGSIVDYEGLDDLLDAVALLRERDLPPFGVLIVGDGAACAKLEEQASRLKLDDVVTFTGRVSHELVEDYYSLVDIAPFPRKSLPVTEMVSPLKPFEAMAMGKTVVASNVAALEEIVSEGENGLLFQKGSTEELASTLERLLRDGPPPTLAPREWVREHRSWEVITEKLSSLYTSLTSPCEPVHLVELTDIEHSKEVADVLEACRDEKHGLGPGHWRHDDYARWTYVGNLVAHHTTLLDVGVGLGQFLNAQAMTGRYDELRGVDVRRHSLFLELTDGFSMDYVSIEALPYADDQFDVVTCLETIEHLPEEIFLPGIEQLRRVCAKQLIVTVPFREEKLYKDHLRRFDFDDLTRLFPSGAITVFRKRAKAHGVPSFWALVEERFD